MTVTLSAAPEARETVKRWLPRMGGQRKVDGAVVVLW
jgi:hypothetical protein